MIELAKRFVRGRGEARHAEGGEAPADPRAGTALPPLPSAAPAGARAARGPRRHRPRAPAPGPRGVAADRREPRPAHPGDRLRNAHLGRRRRPGPLLRRPHGLPARVVRGRLRRRPRRPASRRDCRDRSRRHVGLPLPLPQQRVRGRRRPPPRRSRPARALPLPRHRHERRRRRGGRRCPALLLIGSDRMSACGGG